MGNEANHIIDGLTVTGTLGLRRIDDSDSATITVNADGGLLANGALLGNAFSPLDAGLIAWNADSSAIANTAAVTAAGTLHVMRIKLHAPATVTNVHVVCSTAGVGLTSGQNFAALFSGSTGATRVGVTADQTTAWGTTGEKIMALASGPFSVSAGDLWVALYANAATTLPQFRTLGAPTFTLNVNSYTRWGTSNTGLTTSMPTSLGAISVSGATFWVAIS